MFLIFKSVESLANQGVKSLKNVYNCNKKPIPTLSDGC